MSSASEAGQGDSGDGAGPIDLSAVFAEYSDRYEPNVAATIVEVRQRRQSNDRSRTLAWPALSPRWTLSFATLTVAVGLGVTLLANQLTDIDGIETFTPPSFNS